MTESNDDKKKEEAAFLSDFIRDKVADDVKNGKNGGKVITRLPPEPNGYLHIGHAKAFCLSYSVAAQHNGQMNLRFDDTNPMKEESAYAEAIMEDIKWLGLDWGDNLFHASDYFDQLYEFAIRLIKKGVAYVDDLTGDEIREYRGSLTSPGKESPHRNRTVEENLDLFEKMKAGEFPDGSKTLRAKIDMASPNMNMRDPIMYRIMRATHHRTGDKWCIYPMYDWAHGQSDSIEKITHSLCDIGFEDHRPLYDWFLDQLEEHHPQQIEFARLNISYTILSKRKLIQLVNDNHVSGWDDPRMPTISGMRRRGYTPTSIRNFCDRIGVSKRASLVDQALLEFYVREDLNKSSLRVMAVQDPLKVIITNYPEGQTEEMEAINNPEDELAGSRKVPFSRELYIERADFMEDPPKKFFRLAPGREVRLRYAYFISCEKAVKDEKTGEITELHCTYDPETKGGSAPDGRKVKATMHWVAAETALDAEIREYGTLLSVPNPAEEDPEADFKKFVNPESLKVNNRCKVEPSLADAKPGTRYQFERLGYYCVDPDSTPGHPVFNRTVTLRDAWAKLKKKLK